MKRDSLARAELSYRSWAAEGEPDFSENKIKKCACFEKRQVLKPGLRWDLQATALPCNVINRILPTSCSGCICECHILPRADGIANQSATKQTPKRVFFVCAGGAKVKRHDLLRTQQRPDSEAHVSLEGGAIQWFLLPRSRGE